VALDAVADDMIGLALGAAGDPAARALATQPGIGDHLRMAATVEAAVSSADVLGGTAPTRVRQALADARLRLDREPAGG
jgi:hypothetical protein